MKYTAEEYLYQHLWVSLNIYMPECVHSSEAHFLETLWSTLFPSRHVSTSLTPPSTHMRATHTHTTCSFFQRGPFKAPHMLLSKHVTLRTQTTRLTQTPPSMWACAPQCMYRKDTPPTGPTHTHTHTMITPLTEEVDVENEGGDSGSQALPVQSFRKSFQLNSVWNARV